MYIKNVIGSCYLLPLLHSVFLKSQYSFISQPPRVFQVNSLCPEMLNAAWTLHPVVKYNIKYKIIKRWIACVNHSRDIIRVLVFNTIPFLHWRDTKSQYCPFSQVSFLVLLFNLQPDFERYCWMYSHYFLILIIFFMIPIEFFLYHRLITFFTRSSCRDRSTT